MESFLLNVVGRSYQNKFNEMLNLRIYNDKYDNINFCSYILNNKNNMSLKDLKIFKSNINQNGLKKIIDIINTIDILELEYLKNENLIIELEKILNFYLNIDNN